MIILIAGATHSGKTLFAQKLLERYQFPYLSMDHLKMGLIRSGQTKLTPCDDAELTAYLWPIVREMIKTAIENQQDLIVEGCYIPFDWQQDFDEMYLQHICYRCLIMSPAYIEKHFCEILLHANAIEHRMYEDALSAPELIQQHSENLRLCQVHRCAYIWIDEGYDIDAWIERII